MQSTSMSPSWYHTPGEGATQMISAVLMMAQRLSFPTGQPVCSVGLSELAAQAPQPAADPRESLALHERPKHGSVLGVQGLQGSMARRMRQGHPAPPLPTRTAPHGQVSAPSQQAIAC